MTHPQASGDTALQTYIQYYEYDETGNMLEMKHTAGLTPFTNYWTRAFEIDTDSNRLLSSTVSSVTENYTYDARGNMEGGMNHLDSMTYNAENRLEVVEINSDLTAYYQYDSEGQRVRKTVVNAAATITKTRKYVGQWEVYGKVVGTILELERETLHIMDDTARVALVDTPTVDVNVTGEEQLLRYQYSNHLSTATLELDDAAAIISYEEYYPYGSTSFQSGRTSAEVSLKRYRYTGKERDEESGLYYHGARYYIPWLCRWSAVDPINSEWYNLCNKQPDRNLKRQNVELVASAYEYSYDNPINFSDPSGEQPPPGITHLIVWGAVIKAKLEDWGFELKGGMKDYAEGSTGTGSYNNPYVPKDVQQRVAKNQKIKGATVLMQKSIDVFEFSAQAIGSIPGVDLLADPAFASYYTWKGDYLSAASYTVAAVIPGVSGIEAKMARKATEETVTLFRAVGKEELVDLVEVRKFRAAQNTMESKLFTTKIEDAIKEGHYLFTEKNQAFSIVSVTIPESTYKQVVTEMKSLDEGIGVTSAVGVDITKQSQFNEAYNQINVLQSTFPTSTK